MTQSRAAGLWLAMALCLSSAAVHAQANAPALRGAQLYDGRIALSGQLRGHDRPLPADALRCANCHEPSRQVVAAGSAAASNNNSFAPRLDQLSLTQFQARRGGPATRYDQANFCRVLRSSVDPGLVLLRKPMPQYALSDDDCQALWLFLSQRPAMPTP
jgi:cytochrome c553